MIHCAFSLKRRGPVFEIMFDNSNRNSFIINRYQYWVSVLTIIEIALFLHTFLSVFKLSLNSFVIQITRYNWCRNNELSSFKYEVSRLDKELVTPDTAVYCGQYGVIVQGRRNLRNIYAKFC